MFPRSIRLLWIGILALPVTARPAAAEDTADQGSAATALAWRLDGISSDLLGPTQPPAAWRRSAALLDAAGRLDPSESHFPRLRALALLHVDDTAQAIDAVRAYRKLEPGDRVAQTQLIDLYAGTMETVDARIAYLQSLLDKKDIAPEVRAHVATRCASLLLQKSSKQAADMARRAAELYPLPEALRMYYELAGRELPERERVSWLLKLLRANPAQWNCLGELADVLARAGLSDASIRFYDLAVATILHSGPSRPPEFHRLLIDYAAQQIVAGHGSAADPMLGQMLDEQPLDPDAWFLKLTEARASAGDVTYTQTLDLARGALIRRWNLVHDQILNGTAATQPAETSDAATTAPAAVEPSDPAPVIAKVKDGHSPGRDAALGAMTDLAWFEVCYAKQAAAATPWIDAVAQLMPADSAVVVRLRGWAALAAGKTADARHILAGIAPHDPLAQLGIFRCDQAEKKSIDEKAVMKLLADNRTGLLAAILWDALRTDRTVPATQPSQTELVTLLNQFPVPWLSVLDPRSLRRIYEVTAEPVASDLAYGDPLLIRLTLRNNSDYDITIGSDGFLRPDLWFDASITGLDQRLFRGIAYDQIATQLVLRSGESASEIVRVDEGELRRALRSLPGARTRITGDVITNPISLQDGVVAGPCGMSTNFLRGCSFVGLSIDQPDTRKQLDAAMTSPDPQTRLHLSDLLAGYIRLSHGDQADDAMKKTAAAFPDMLSRLRKDSSAPVSAWSGYLSAEVADPAGRKTIAEEMSRSSDWTSRLLSLFASGPASSADSREIAARLAKDSDADVKTAAAATLELADEPTTRP